MSASCAVSSSPTSAWHSFLAFNESLSHLRETDLLKLDFASLVHRVKAERVAVLSLVKAAGVSKLSDRQALASALSRHTKLTAEAAAAFAPALRPRVALVVTINVHEIPSFIMHHLEHVKKNLPGSHRIVLNCNAAMHEALRPLLPDAFVWEADAEPAGGVLVHPQPLEKRRFHGSLLQGIVRNLELATRRWDFDAFLVLSSRSWFRRPLGLPELLEARTPVPPGVKRAMLRHTANGVRFVDTSDEPASLQLQPGGVALTGFDWGPLLRTRLGYDYLAGCTKVNGPHEGLLLEHAACARALEVLGGASALGADLYATEAAVEEFALQSIAHLAGARFAQLSDFGEREGVAESALDARGDHVTPLTKVERRTIDAAAAPAAESPEAEDHVAVASVDCGIQGRTRDGAF